MKARELLKLWNPIDEASAKIPFTSQERIKITEFVAELNSLIPIKTLAYEMKSGQAGLKLDDPSLISIGIYLVYDENIANVTFGPKVCKDIDKLFYNKFDKKRIRYSTLSGNGYGEAFDKIWIEVKK